MKATILGAGTMKRLLEAGFAISQVSHIFFSHLHPDHTGEFVSFLFATKYPQTSQRLTPLQLVGAKGLRRFYNGLLRVYGNWIALDPGFINLT